jgi:hypothetical protein
MGRVSLFEKPGVNQFPAIESIVHPFAAHFEKGGMNLRVDIWKQ